MRGFEPRDHLLRLKRGGDVDVLDLYPQQRVAHRTADIAGLTLTQRRYQRGKVIAAGPVRPG